jgi:hypothetical protein
MTARGLLGKMGMQIMRVPGWGFDYCEARYYGRRHSVHIGPVLIFWGQMTEAELRAHGADDRPTHPSPAAPVQ